MGAFGRGFPVAFAVILPVVVPHKERAERCVYLSYFVSRQGGDKRVPRRHRSGIVFWRFARAGERLKRFQITLSQRNAETL